MSSWKPEVQVAGEGEKWLSNALRFATKAEAETSARDLARRWLLVTNHQAVESIDPVNYMIKDDVLIPIRLVMMRDMKAGDLAVVDAGFECHPGGEVTIGEDREGLFFPCKAGNHYLSGQVGDDGLLVGIYKSGVRT